MAFNLTNRRSGAFFRVTTREGRARRRQHETAGRAATGLRLQQVIDEFLDAAERGSARRRDGRRFTRDEVRELRWCLEGHLAHELGAMRLNDLRRDDVEAFVHRLWDAGISRRRLRAVVASVRALYDDAGRRGLVGHNPAERVALPDDLESDRPVRGAARRSTALGGAVSLVPQAARLGLAVIALLFIVQSL